MNSWWLFTGLPLVGMAGVSKKHEPESEPEPESKVKGMFKWEVSLGQILVMMSFLAPSTAWGISQWARVNRIDDMVSRHERFIDQQGLVNQKLTDTLNLLGRLEEKLDQRLTDHIDFQPHSIK